MKQIGFGSQIELGAIVLTQQAYRLLPMDEVNLCLQLHMGGYWGELRPYEQEQNEIALLNGGRLMSVYESLTGVSFWIVTQPDRAFTTVLLDWEFLT